VVNQLIKIQKIKLIKTDSYTIILYAIVILEAFCTKPFIDNFSHSSIVQYCVKAW